MLSKNAFCLFPYYKYDTIFIVTILLLTDMARLPNLKLLSILLVCAFLFQTTLLHEYVQQDNVLPHEPRPFDGVTSSSPRSNDWKPVYVYRGGPPLALVQPWNGQAEQDKLISWLTKNMTNGYFVDLAANGARYLSNTISLERHFNWNGLCIEANPMYWNDLGRFRSCTVVGAAIGRQANEKMMFVMAGAMGGLAGESFDNKEESGDRHSIEERYTAQLEMTFETFNVPKIIDYFSLDVEGAEDFIMDSFPFERYRIRFLTVERPSSNLTKKLAGHGYRLVKKLVFFGDTLFAHDSEMPIEMAIIDKYCADSGGKYCNDKESLLGFRFDLESLRNTIAQRKSNL